MKRRQFIQQSALGTVGLAVAGAAISCDEQNLNKEMSIPQKETLKKSMLTASKKTESTSSSKLK